MIAQIIRWSIAHRIIVLTTSIAIAVASIWAAWRTPIDAIPDLSDVQVIVMTEWPGQAPSLVEDQVTYPLSTELLRVPGSRVVRGMSQFGLSAVFVIFEDGTDLYWARSRVLEVLNGAQSRLPVGAVPRLGPDATGVGWVLQYLVVDTSGARSLAELRSLQDWTIRPALSSVPGVAEIASIGGFTMQYQIDVDPVRLQAFRIPMQAVVRAVQASNEDVGGRVLELGGTEYVVRGRGRVEHLADLRQVSLGSGPGGIPVTVNDVATVHLGPDQRRGISDLNGKGDIVSGWVVMRYGGNPLEVIRAVKERMSEVERALPNGVVFREGYDRSGLIRDAIETLGEKLVEEALIVALVTLLFLLHARSALVAVVTLPLGIGMALLAMRALGLSANIMSLGGIAIAIGAMIDAAIVMVENLHKHLERMEAAKPGERLSTEDRWQAVVASSTEVGPSLFVSLLIITISFLPVFALEAQEGRLFAPLAWTKTLAMAAAALLSVTLVPVLMGLWIRGTVRPEARNPVNRALIAAYRPMIRLVLAHRVATVAVATLILFATAWPWINLGREFMPPLDEGAIMDMPSLLPGVGAQQAQAILRQRDAAMASVPEVERVIGKVGRAETATDMAPMSMIESIAVLKPEREWRNGVDRDSISALVEAAVRTPGVANMWSMPIRNRLDMLATGIKTPVGIKVIGPELEILDSLVRQIEVLLPAISGTRSVFAERSLGGRYLDITVDRNASARHGLTIDDVQQTVMTAVGGAPAGVVIAGRERYGILVRYPRELRDRPEVAAAAFVATRSGAMIPIAELARIDVVPGPTLIKSENGTLTSIVYIDVGARDIGGYVSEARAHLERSMILPPGYRLEWSGQYEALDRAERRLAVVVPITLLLIAILLVANFRSIAETAIVMLSLPFALVGGVWLMWVLEYNMSVATAIGFIALAGVAAETGVIMLLYLNQAFRERREAGALMTRADHDAAVIYGAVERVRPKMMTVTAIMAGLVPILWSQGVGADVMKRIAAPMVGGMLSSTVMTLLVIPAIYSLWKGRTLEAE